MRHEQRAHMDEVLATTGAPESTPSEREALISDSWRRCIDQHRLDPTLMKEAYILPSERLREHRDRMDEFLHTARFGVETLYRQVAGMGYVLLLTDARGITVDFIGDPTFDNQLQKAGLYLGADWHEAHAGTCGVGTCLSSGEALVVHQGDHFDATHMSLTCTAAPIFDAHGEIAAVLDISALRSPQPKSSQHLALQLVGIYTNRIENAHLMRRFRHEWLLRLSRAPEFADVDPEYVIALDASGLVVGFNHRAQRLLADEIGVSWRAPGQLLGRRLDEIFDCRLDDLTRYVRSRPAEQRVVTLTHSRSVLFAQALPPETVPPRLARSERSHPLPHPLDQLSGGDAAMARQLTRAARLVNTHVSILLQGETGTGKEYLAKAMHAASARSERPFVAVNCGAIPEALIESELFGYQPGTFSGAHARGKTGLIAAANGGTLFLDEIGAMPLALQTRLLRVLSERELLPLGATRALPLDVRVVAASNDDLSALVAEGRFRDDLYYRLNGAVLTLPPLRERSDLDWLIHRLSAGRRDAAGRRPVLTNGARELLHRHCWPGNVRELVNTIEYACAMCVDARIEAEDLPETLLASVSAAARPAVVARVASSTRPAESLEAVLARHAWNVTAAARTLGVSRSTVHRRIRRLGLVPPNQRG